MNRLQDCFDDDDAGEIGDGFAGQLFQGMRHDPSMPPMDFAPRHFSPALKRWMADEPCGCVDGMEAYIVESDNPMLEGSPRGE